MRSTADADFREFVANYADAVTRLAGLLLAASPRDVAAAVRVEDAVVRAFARTRRDWCDVSSVPELHAVEVLLTRVPHRRARHDSDFAVVDFADDDQQSRVAKSAMWRAWCELESQHRASMLLANPGVASGRFDGIEVQPSVVAKRNTRRWRHEADGRLRFALEKAGGARLDIDAATERWLASTLADVAARFATPIDVHRRVVAQTRRLRWRTGLALAATVALLAGGLTVATITSQRAHSPGARMSAILMTAVTQTAHRWQQSGTFPSGTELKVAWQGIDPVDDTGLIVRTKRMASPALFVIGWSSDKQVPPQTRAYRVGVSASDTPFAFYYQGRDGSRVGVLVPPGASRAELIVDGVALPAVQVSDDGFVSLPVSGQSGLLAEQAIQVRLLEPSGRVIGTPVVPLQPIVGVDGG